MKRHKHGHVKVLREARIKEEVEAVRDHVGVLDLAGFSRYNLSGEALLTGWSGKSQASCHLLGKWV